MPALVTERQYVQELARLCDRLAIVGVENAILDGEINCLDDEGKPDFYSLLFRGSDPVFYAFDLVWVDGVDLRRRPLMKPHTGRADLL